MTFHAGELAVQRRAGVPGEAARLVGMLAPPRLDGRVAGFLGQWEFALLTGRDRQGVLWISPLTGPAGFLDAHGTTLDVHAGPAPGDPLSGPPAGQQVGLLNPETALLFVDFAGGATVHLSGEARLEWLTPGSPGDDDGTGRRVRFRPSRVVTSRLPVRGGAAMPSPHNPVLR